MALSEKSYAENKMTKWKTKYKTGATRYTRKSYVEEYLENPVLGSASCTVSWVGALAFDPTSLPPIRELGRDARGQKKETERGRKKRQETHRDQEREPETRATERNPHGQPGQAGNRTPSHFSFRFGCGGSWVGALCSVLVENRYFKDGIHVDKFPRIHNEGHPRRD